LKPGVDYLGPEDGYDQRVERVARGVGVGSAGQGVGRLLGYATHAGVAWMYGPAVALNLLLVPTYGVAGAAAATAAALVLANGSSLIFVHRRLGFWPYDRRYARPLIAGLIAAALTFASRQSIPSLEGLPAILLFAPLTLAVFFGVLVCLGLYPSDRLFLASFAGALKNTLRREPVR